MTLFAEADSRQSGRFRVVAQLKYKTTEMSRPVPFRSPAINVLSPTLHQVLSRLTQKVIMGPDYRSGSAFFPRRALVLSLSQQSVKIEKDEDVEREPRT